MYSTQGRSSLVSMSGLARSLISDLKLDKPPFQAGCPSNGPIIEDRGPRTNDERRALLACFALSATVCLTFKYDSMRWSTQVEEACHRLSQDAETEGDKILVYIARIARLSVSAAEMSRRAAEDPMFGRHAILNVGSLRAALEELKAALPGELSDHSTIITYLYSAEVGIYELALYYHPASPSTLTNSLSLLQPEMESRRVTYLTTLLLTCRSYTEFFLASDIIYMTATSMLVFPYCIKIAHKLQTLKIPGWDPAFVNATLDPVRCVERAAQAAEVGNKVLKARISSDTVFKTLAENLWKSAPLWRVNLDAEDAAEMETNMGIGNVRTEHAHFSGNGSYFNDGWMDPDFPSDFWLAGTFDLS